MIDERVAQWRELVPFPLAHAAATVICERDQPCEDCVDETASVLAYVYAYNAYATKDSPCPACQFARRFPKTDLFESCVFHEGMDQGMLQGWHPSEPVRVTTKPPSRWWPRQWLPLPPRVELIVAAIVMAIWLSIGIWIATRP